MHIWRFWAPKVEDDSLHLKCGDGNERDMYVVTVMIGGKTGGYFSKN